MCRLFTVTWWLSEATPCLSWALSDVRDESQPGSATARPGSLEYSNRGRKTPRIQFRCLWRGAGESSLSLLELRQRLHPFRASTPKPSKNSVSKDEKLNPRGGRGASNKLTDRWKSNLPQKSRFYLRDTVLCGGICHPPSFENRLPTV